MTDAVVELAGRLPPPAGTLRIAVVMPVRDEAESLPGTLAALTSQQTLGGEPFPPAGFEAIVLANNCGDESVAVARRAAEWHRDRACIHVVEARFAEEHAHVGHARRVAMEIAASRLEAAGRPRAFIASTDGDTCAAADWLATLADEIDRGADAVGGRILTRPSADTPFAVARRQRLDAVRSILRCRLESLLDPDPADPWPRHHQHFGANMAVTLEAYRRVGGLPEVRFLEDEALFAALRRADSAIRHSPRPRVFTSGRQMGRVEVGLSWQLREWARLEDSDPALLVEDASELLALGPARRRLRALWPRRHALRAADDGLPAFAVQLGLPLRPVLRQLRAATGEHAAWSAWMAMREARQIGASRRISLNDAIEELRAEISDRLPPAGSAVDRRRPRSRSRA